MPSRYLIDIILQIAKKGTGGKDLTKELEGVDTATKKLKDSWQSIAGTGAAVVGAVVAVKKAFDIGKEGAMIAQTAQSFDLLMQKVGASADIMDRLRAASRSTVDDMTLMSSTSTLLAGTQGELASRLAQSTPQLLEIAKAANKLNPTLGDTTFLYQSLALGIKRASPMILDNLGLTIKLGAANEAMAAKLGKSVDALTAEEKQMALLEATLQAGGVMMDQVGGSTEAMGDAFAQAEVKIKNATDQIKAELAPSIADVTTEIAEAIPAVRTTSDQLVAMADAGFAWAHAALTGEDATSAFNEAIKRSVGYYDAAYEADKRWADHAIKSREIPQRATESFTDSILEANVAVIDSVAAYRASEQGAKDLARAQDELASAVSRVMERYEGFYGTLAEGLVSFRDLTSAQEESAQEYESALAELQNKQRNAAKGMKFEWEASLPDATDVAQRLGMAGDAWDEWGLRLQDIINQGVASPWFETLQQMGMQKPPDIGVKEWAADLKEAFYAGEVPDLLPPEWAENVRSQQQEATAAFQAEAGKRRAAVQEEIDALNAAREAQLEAERQARNEATTELAMSLAEQTGALQAWSEEKFGPDFSTIADSASEVMGLLESGMLEMDSSLQTLLEGMVSGIGTMLDTTGEAAEANKAALQEIAEYDPFAEMVEPADQFMAKMAEVGGTLSQVIAPEEMPEDPLGLSSMFTGMTNIMDAAGEMSSELTTAFQDVEPISGSVAEAVYNQWVGNSTLPDIATGAMNMSNLTVAAFQTMQAVGTAAGASIGTSWATGLQAAQAELKKMVSQLKSLPTEIEIHLTTVVTGGGGLQHGGQWTVRGQGGIDNVPVSFMATAGETVTVTPVGRNPPPFNGPGGFQHGGQFRVGGAQTVYVSGDTHTWNIQDQGSVALAMRLVENKRKERLNEFMGA